MVWQWQPQKWGNGMKCKGVQALYHKSGVEDYSGNPIAISNPLAIS